MKPKHQRAADRLRELIDEGKQVAALERPAQHVGPYIQDKVALYAWLVKVENIVSSIFKQDSAHYQHLGKVAKKNPEHAYEINKIIGILTGALSDLEGGFLIGQEHLIAGETFDSVLEQAKHLAKNGFKDPAAVLARVVVEDCLRRISREEGLDDTAKLLPSTMLSGTKADIQSHNGGWCNLGLISETPPPTGSLPSIVTTMFCT